MPSHAEHGCRCLPRQAAWLQARTMLSHRRGAMPSHARRGCRCLPRQAAWLQARVLSHRREAMRCRRMPKNVLRPSFLHLGGPFLHPGIGRCASDHAFWSYSEGQGARRWCRAVVLRGFVYFVRDHTRPAVPRVRSAAALRDDGEVPEILFWSRRTGGGKGYSCKVFYTINYKALRVTQCHSPHHVMRHT